MSIWWGVWAGASTVSREEIFREWADASSHVLETSVRAVYSGVCYWPVQDRTPDNIVENCGIIIMIIIVINNRGQISPMTINEHNRLTFYIENIIVQRTTNSTGNNHKISWYNNNK